jgi:hypothetical protein
MGVGGRGSHGMGERGWRRREVGMGGTKGLHMRGGGKKEEGKGGEVKRSFAATKAYV